MVGEKRSALGWLNALSPKDKASRRVAENVAYGPDPRHRLDIYAPTDFPEALPVVHFIYGGGWHSGTRADYEFAGRAFAAAGFVTIVSDYRLVPDVHFPAFIEDGARAQGWIATQIGVFGGDPDRQFLIGHSAGAYNAMMLALDGERFGAPAPGGWLKGVIGLSGPYDFYPFDVKEAIDAFSRAADPERTQPVNLVSLKAPPALLAHGTADRICGLYNTQNLAKAMRREGVAVTEIHYRNVRHAMTLLSLFPALRWRLPVYRDAVGFMRKHVQA